MERDQAERLIAVLERIARALEQKQDPAQLPLVDLLDIVERSYWNFQEQHPLDDVKQESEGN